MLCILTSSFFQTLVGVYAKEVHVRLACLTAIKCVPVNSVQRDLQVSTSLWIAAHDPEKVCSIPVNLTWNSSINLFYVSEICQTFFFLEQEMIFIFLLFGSCTFSRWLLN